MTYKYYLWWLEASPKGKMLDTKLFRTWLAERDIHVSMPTLYLARAHMREHGLMLYRKDGQPYLKPLD